MGEIINLKNLLFDSAKKEKQIEEKDNSKNYKEIFDIIVHRISNNHSNELATALYEKGMENRIKDLINTYLVLEKILTSTLDFTSLTDKIYEDMAGIGFIKKHLENKDVEEININGKDEIYVLYSDRKEKLLDRYDDARDCINVVKKMARMGGLILDGSTPVGDSYIAKGVRMSAAIYPAVDEETGAICSIRKQKPSYINRENLIEFGTASSDELDFLTECLNRGISVAIAGSTGSGKTADVNYLLNSIDDSNRIVTIEDTKELMVKKADVVQLYTKEPPNPVTMQDLLKLTLRLHPDVLVPAEMRGGEAVTAIEAARTGHTALTTLHANGAREAYARILTMYRQVDSNLSEDTILKMIIEAFPIVVFKMQMQDKSRKYIEIFEATDVKDGNVTGKSIFKFVAEGIDCDGQIVGSHRQVNDISEKLANTMLLRGSSEDTIRRYKKDFRKE